MNMINKLKISLSLLLLITLLSCEKQSLDYREAIMGKWVFSIERTEFNTDSIGYYFHDSLGYNGQINLGSRKDEIIISYTTENSITLLIDPDYGLSGFPTRYCSGSFEGMDRLNLYLRWGGLGGGITHVVEGMKE
jgi:hypothetical protein